MSYPPAALAILALSIASQAAAAWTHEAYVWQRQPAPAALDAALENTRGFLDAFCFLAAEVSFGKNDAPPKIIRVPLDCGKLAAFSAAARKPIALAIRVGTLTTQKQFADFQPRLAALAAEILSTARAAGLDPAELQIDFDCPESKLGLYRDWLAALRPAIGKTPLAFTALPAWLDHAAAFAALASEADSFVLQVHSLEKPRDIRDHFSLCPRDAALRHATRASDLAARAGTRFRVALPTYGYTLGFNAEGRFIGLAAETPRDWPAGAQLRNVRSDPAAMQSLAHELAAAKFPRATGIAWFRLPVEGDHLAWNAGTLAAVIQNKPITTRLAVEIHRARPGLAEIIVINRGQTAEPLPETLRITWTRGFRPIAYDALGGYSFYYDNGTSGAAGTFVVSRKLTADELAPGRSRVIGWVRFDFSESSNNTENFSIHAAIP